MQLYFISPMAQRHHVSVSVVNDGKALAYGESYTVRKEVGAALLETGDWSDTPPQDAEESVTEETNNAE